MGVALGGFRGRRTGYMVVEERGGYLAVWRDEVEGDALGIYQVRELNRGPFECPFPN